MGNVEWWRSSKVPKRHLRRIGGKTNGLRSTAQPVCEKHKKQRSKGARAEEMFSDSTAVSLQEGCIPIDVLGLITT